MNELKRILLVDDHPEELEIFVQMLSDMEDRWKIESADSGSLALQKMQLRPFDVLVTDFHMPRMTGEELLKKVMLQSPDTVRIVLSGFFDTKVTDRVVQMAHQYLSKPCTTVELKEAIARALFLRDLRANQNLKNCIARIETLPGLPGLYTELLIELQRANPSLDALTNVLCRDLSVSSKLLHLANTPFFGFEERVGDVKGIIARLGFEPIKALVLSLLAFSAFERIRKDDRSFKALWTHSWAVGRLAQRIGEIENFESYGVQQSFSAGLLHDVGKLVFLTGVPKEFARAEELQRESRIPLWQAEQEIFGCTHAEVGAYLLGLWGLPISVVETVAQHHCPSVSSTHSVSVITAVHAADAIEREAEITAHSPALAELDQTYLARLGLLDHLTAWRELRCDVVAEAA